jgi:predicted transposase/invertase (TIGR01784 family)
MKPGIDPKVDYAFKRVFGSPEATDVLVSMLNAVLAPPSGEEVTAVELQNPFNEKDASDDKQLILDVKARDARGRWFNVEMQMAASTIYPQRVLYYWAALFTDQLKEGRGFDELRPTISISFLDSRRFKDKVYHHRFRLRDDCGEVTLTDHLEIHLVELPKFTLTAEQLTTTLEMWCYFLKHGEELDTEALPAKLDVPPVRRALEVLNVMSLNDREREVYQAKLKARRDRNAEIQDARLSGRILAYQEILNLPITPEEDLQTMSLEELQALVEALKKQVAAAVR